MNMLASIYKIRSYTFPNIYKRYSQSLKVYHSLDLKNKKKFSLVFYYFSGV